MRYALLALLLSGCATVEEHALLPLCDTVTIDTAGFNDKPTYAQACTVNRQSGANFGMFSSSFGYAP